MGPYRILGHLGRGGMAEVFRARDPRTGREVALKCIHVPMKAQYHRRFLREVEALKRVRHPAVVCLLDVFSLAEDDCLVMELVHGEGLDRRIRRGAVDVPTAVHLARQIAGGLAELHAQGIVHRDLKAENVMVTRDGQAKILDFGLARLLWNTVDADATPLTMPGNLIGTIAAMSPEQAAGDPAGPAADVFSLGVLLYRMLSGRPPFEGVNLVQLLHRIVKCKPPPLGGVRPDLPDAVVEMTHRLLVREAARRPTAARAEAELRQLEDALAADHG